MDCQACRLGTITVPCAKEAQGEVCVRCDGAGHRLHRNSIVWGEGPYPNPIMLLGEAPGHYEDLEGLPFRPNAPAGRVLHRALEQTGIEPYVDNLVHCRPPDNRLKDYPDAIETCTRLWLAKQIAKVQPRVIVVLGAVAAGPWMPGLRAGQIAGLARSTDGVIICGAYHPAYVARGDPTAWPSLVRSLLRAKELAT